MSEWLVGLAGTETGHWLAVGLALLAAFTHAIFGALQKGRFDPWLMRGAMDVSYGLMAAPFALFVVPWPEPHMWLIFAGVLPIHLGYKLFQAMAYSKGAYTVVYPVVRGTGPLVTVLAAGVVFGERFTLAQWLGVALLLGAIFALAGVNLRQTKVARAQLWQALGLAFVTGLFVALYTTYDAYGIRATADPFTFLAWFFMIDGMIFPFISARYYKNMAYPPALGPLMRRGFLGGLIAYASFGSVMMATRLDTVGQAAVLRETSVVFAALIGWFFLKEKVGPLQGMLMALIALGAVVVEFG
ncbi:MAG: EamA family transporter [Rhodobacteraceae bacterium]|nr:EamA family transporter [Paracoccaceae bacterium]